MCFRGWMPGASRCAQLLDRGRPDALMEVVRWRILAWCLQFRRHRRESDGHGCAWRDRRAAGTPGVYRFRDARGGVLYIGRATALRHRVASYWSDLRERGYPAPMVARVTRIEAVTCDSPHEAAWLERNLLEASLPP
jgi:hypothetical protein